MLTLHAVADREAMDMGGKLLLFVDQHVPELVVYLNEMVLSQDARRRELGLRLQEKVLGLAAEGGRRVTLYLNQQPADGHIELHPELNSPGWAPSRPLSIDSSTVRGASILDLLEKGIIRICHSPEELNARPELQETARDPARFPAYAVIPMLAGSDSMMTIGIMEVECRDQLLPIDTAQLIAMASVLACAKLLELETATGADGGHAHE